jgi:prephenate dehydrogenase
MKKILIFGIGLIGGSIALKIKQKKLFDHIIGVGRSGGTSLTSYVSTGMLDVATNKASEEIASTDLIIIATPVAQTKKILADIYPFLNEKSVITDVGSTKSDVMAAAKECLKEKYQQFIGSHPIAGSEKHGASAANFQLFENKDIIITPHDNSLNSTIDYLRKFWVSLGGRVSNMTPEIHDEIFSTVSHIPHLLAFGLVNLINNKSNKDQLLNFAASGFRDFSRIAASSPEVWRDISLANKRAILNDLKLYQDEISSIIKLIEEENTNELDQYLIKASTTRSEWIESQK